MNFWKVILATVVIFGAGVFTGGLLVNYVNHSHRNNNHRPPANVEAHPPTEAHDSQSHTNNLANLPRPRPPEILGAKFVQQLDDALQLTPDQHASIQKIITDGQERNRAIWTNNSAQMRLVIQDVRHRVRETLTADQQKQFEDLMKRVPRRQQNSTNAPPPSMSGSNIPPTSIFKQRLEALRQDTTPQTLLTPESQMKILESEKNQELALARPPSPVLPPPPTNAPAN